MTPPPLAELGLRNTSRRAISGSPSSQTIMLMAQCFAHALQFARVPGLRSRLVAVATLSKLSLVIRVIVNFLASLD
jgi:hypothetical protein